MQQQTVFGFSLSGAATVIRSPPFHDSVERTCDHTSSAVTKRALASMNSRRGSTASPISVWKI